MFCYHGTCQNQSGDALAGYFVEAVVGSTVQTIYADNSSTPIITSSGVANRAKSDSRGNFFFYIADGVYDLKYYNAQGVYQFTETGFSMISAEGIAAAATSAAAASTSATAAASSASAAAAYTSAKSANTAALISAVRTNGYFPAPTTRAPAADIPTVALGTADANSTINGNAPTSPNIPFTSSKLSYLSGVPKLAASSYPLSNYINSRGAYYGAKDAVPNPLYATQFTAIEFIHTGTALEVPYFGSGGYIRAIVNGAIAALHNSSTTGSLYYLKLTFPSSATRRIVIESTNLPIGGINVASTSEVAATGRSYPIVTVMGDSFVEAAGTIGYDGEAEVMGRVLGVSTAVAGVGATGLLNPGGNNTAGFPKVNWQNATRLLDLTLSGVTSDQTSAAVSPAMGVVMMSVNDSSVATTYWGGASNLQDAIANGVYALIDAWKAANPTKPLVFFGPTWTSETPLLSVYSIRDGCEEACLNSSNVWFIDRLGPGPYLRKGTEATLTTTGTLTSGSAVITGMASQTGLQVGSQVLGTGIPTDAVVKSIDSGTQITLSANATASGSQTLTIATDQASNYTSLVLGDVTHPNRRGHSYDGRWMATQLRHLILNEFA